jgi:hypothetical protein
MNETVEQQTINISRPPPNGLGHSAALQHDFLELYLTPCID